MRKTLIVSLLILLPSLVFSYPADVVPIPNREYVPALHNALKNAEKTIKIFMFSARYYPQYKNDANSLILNDLISAAQRGVDVEVILDASNWNRSNTLDNKAFADTLRKCGVKVYFDPPDVTSHDKLIIVDGKITIVGSTNWSYYALERNNEASVLIYSEEVADYFTKYFEKVKDLSTEKMPEWFLE
ncbi:MAG: phospholipase D-like domain-containing protein [Candidatus Hydrothermia bacterium]